MYRAGTRAARIAARSARSARDPGIRMSTGADGEDGQLLVELKPVASRTGRLLARPRQVFEPMTAVATGELEQRHDFIITQILIGRPGV